MTRVADGSKALQGTLPTSPKIALEAVGVISCTLARDVAVSTRFAKILKRLWRFELITASCERGIEDTKNIDCYLKLKV